MNNNILNEHKFSFINWLQKIENFTLIFLITYILSAFFMHLIFKMELYSYHFLGLYFILTLSLYSGLKLSRSFNKFKSITKINTSQKKILKPTSIISLIEKFKAHEEKYLMVIIFTPFFSIIFSWIYILTHYYANNSNYQTIFTSLRNQMISNPRALLPVYFSYENGLIFFTTIYALLKFKNNKCKSNLVLVIISILFIFLNDLMSFGRIGILCLIFIFIGICYINKTNILKLRYFIYSIIMISILMLPRLIRGNFDLIFNQSQYITFLSSSYKWIPAIIIDMYAYYFASPYALSELIKTNQLEVHTYGTRIFTPIINLFSHIFPSIQQVSFTDSFINGNLYGNIYSVIRDYYGDFGIPGVIFIPFIIGIYFGYFFQKRGIYADILKIIFFIWLFFVPIYHVFMMGSMLLSVIIATSFYFIFDHQKNK